MKKFGTHKNFQTFFAWNFDEKQNDPIGFLFFLFSNADGDVFVDAIFQRLTAYKIAALSL